MGGSVPAGREELGAAARVAAPRVVVLLSPGHICWGCGALPSPQPLGSRALVCDALWVRERTAQVPRCGSDPGSPPCPTGRGRCHRGAGGAGGSEPAHLGTSPRLH